MYCDLCVYCYYIYSALEIFLSMRYINLHFTYLRVTGCCGAGAGPRAVARPRGAGGGWLFGMWTVWGDMRITGWTHGTHEHHAPRRTRSWGWEWRCDWQAAVHLQEVQPNVPAVEEPTTSPAESSWQCMLIFLLIVVYARDGALWTLLDGKNCGFGLVRSGLGLILEDYWLWSRPWPRRLLSLNLAFALKMRVWNPSLVCTLPADYFKLN